MAVSCLLVLLILLLTGRPAGAAHHQKIVVIDDALAFYGGIDITTDRWDTRTRTFIPAA